MRKIVRTKFKKKKIKNVFVLNSFPSWYRFDIYHKSRYHTEKDHGHNNHKLERVSLCKFLL